MKNILLTGTYNSKNKGDAAMELATVQALQKVLPDADIRIHSPFPEIDRPFYAPMPVVMSTRRRLIWGTFQVLRGYLWRILGKPGFLINGNNELEAFAQADIVVDLSGDMQTESYGPHVAYSHFLPLALGLAMGKKVMLCAQSIGPFTWTAPLARFLFNRMRAITVRDQISLDYLNNFGVRPPVELTADMAFLLAPSQEERIDAILQEEAIPLVERNLFGVSVSGLIARHFSKRNPLSSQMDFYQFMAEELDAIIEKINMDCVFVAHVNGPAKNKDDRIAAESVISYMKHADRTFLLRGEYRPDELKGIISRFKFHTGARMHANIAAVTTGVPVVPISYSHKTPGVMGQFGLKEYVVDIATWNKGELLKKILAMISAQENVVRVMEECIEPLEKRSMVNVDRILSILAEHS